MFKFVKFVELPVDDQDRAVGFYTERLGFIVAQHSPYQEGWNWIELEIPGARTAILLTKRADDAPRKSPAIVLSVEDVQMVYDDLTTKGVDFSQPPTQAPWNPGESFAQFLDSEGNTILIGSEAD